MHKIFVSAVLLLMLKAVPAQVTQQWTASYGTSGDDLGKKIKVDGSGNAYVLGNTNNWSTNGNVVLIKYNSTGTPLWSTSYTSPLGDDDQPTAFTFDASGNIYVTGSSQSHNGLYFSEAFVVKFNSSGVQQWVSRYYLTGISAYSQAIAVDVSGNIFIAGYVSSSTLVDYLTIKYNSSGVQQWVKTYNGSASQEDRASSVALDASGNLYVNGSSKGQTLKRTVGGVTTTPTGDDIVTIKYDTNGNELWIARYNYANLSDFPAGMQLDAAGNVYVGGTCGVTSSNGDFITLKYNSSGTLQWMQHFGGIYFDQAWGFVADGAGNTYLTGSFNNGSDIRSVTIKYNTDGALQYNTYWGSEHSEGYTITTDIYGNAYVGIRYTGAFLTVKYSTTGAQLWAVTYKGPANLSASPMAIATYTPSGPVAKPASVYVTGYCTGSAADIATVKYTQQLINGRPAPLTEEELLAPTWSLSVSSVPASSTSKIIYEVGKESDVTITLYNIEGKKMRVVPVNGRKTQGRYSTDLNTSSFPAGMYQCVMTANSADGMVRKNVSFVVVR